MNRNDESEPFLYAVGWTKLDRWYLGCRYAKGCSPKDLWTTYFTSSRYVRAFREMHGEPDFIEILDTGTRSHVLAREENELRRWSMHRDERFLNLGIGGKSFTRPDDPSWKSGGEEFERWRASVTETMRSPEMRAAVAETRRGRKHSAETIDKMRQARRQGPTDEARQKMRLAKLGNQNARKQGQQKQIGETNDLPARHPDRGAL